MIKIALAGTSGLAQYFAHYISTQTCHQFVFLSRKPKPALTERGWQVLTVDYENKKDVRYKLMGVDTVVSTISGPAQLSLIEAAAAVHVRRFVPSEFEGSLMGSPSTDPLDRGQKAALTMLQEKQKAGMEYTVFSCGVFYERFYPGGLAALQLGAGTHIADEGQYILEMRQQIASIPRHPSGEDVYICLTSAEDVACYLVALLDFPHWPNEILVAAERLKIEDIVSMAEIVTGKPFQRQYYDHATLEDSISYAWTTEDIPEYWRLQYLMATLQRRYDFQHSPLSQAVNIQSKSFLQWLMAAWSNAV